MPRFALLLVLAACGGGGLAPDDDSFTIDVRSTRFPVVFSDSGLLATVDEQHAAYTYYYCQAAVSNTAQTVFGFSTTLFDPYYVPCQAGPAFDAEDRVMQRGADTLAIGTSSGPWATYYLGAWGACGTTVLADGTYVTCAGDDLVALSPQGPMVFRIGIGGAATLGLITDDHDTVFATVTRADGTWHLVGVSATGSIVFDVPTGEPQDTLSLDNDGTVLISAVTATGPAVQVFDPTTGELLREVPLDKPSLSVLVAEDDDWVVTEIGLSTEGSLTGDDTLKRLRPDGEARWTRDGRSMGWPAIDDHQRLWVHADDEVHILNEGGGEVDAFFAWGSIASGPPVLHDGWYGATWDGYARVVRLNDPNVHLARTGWPREGGSNRNDGRRPTP